MDSLDILEELINAHSLLSCALERHQEAIDHLRAVLLELRHEDKQ